MVFLGGLVGLSVLGLDSPAIRRGSAHHLLMASSAGAHIRELGLRAINARRPVGLTSPDGLERGKGG